MGSSHGFLHRRTRGLAGCDNRSMLPDSDDESVAGFLVICRSALHVTPAPIPVPAAPVFTGPSATASDGSGALTCGHRTQPDCVRRTHGAWHAEGQTFGDCLCGLCPVSTTILRALTSPLPRSINLPELTGQETLRWTTSGGTDSNGVNVNNAHGKGVDAYRHAAGSLLA
jgi:hypothetical protein